MEQDKILSNLESGQDKISSRMEMIQELLLELPNKGNESQAEIKDQIQVLMNNYQNSLKILEEIKNRKPSNQKVIVTIPESLQNDIVDLKDNVAKLKPKKREITKKEKIIDFLNKYGLFIIAGIIFIPFGFGMFQITTLIKENVFDNFYQEKFNKEIEEPMKEAKKKANIYYEQKFKEGNDYYNQKVKNGDNYYAQKVKEGDALVTQKKKEADQAYIDERAKLERIEAEKITKQAKV